MPPPVIGLDLRLVDQRCAEAGVGGGAFLAALMGGATGSCGARKARITLTPDAKNECVRRGIVPPGDIVICVNPKCGRAVSDMKNLQSVLELLK